MSTAPKTSRKATTRSMGDPEKMRPRTCKRDFFRASSRKWAFPRNSGQRPIASARTAVKEQSPSRDASLAPLSGDFGGYRVTRHIQISVGVFAPAPRAVSAIRVQSDSLVAIVGHAQMLTVMSCEAKPQRFDWLTMSIPYRKKVTLFQIQFLNFE